MIKDGFRVTKNNLYQTLPTLFKQWSISFHIMPLGINPLKENTNILHIGTGGNWHQYGDRSPAIYFHPLTTEMHIYSAINGNKNFHCKFTASLIPMNEWTRVEVSQLRQSDDSYQFTIRKDDIIVFQIENTDPRTFTAVKVYTSHDYKHAAIARLANLTITTFPKSA